MAQSGVPQLTGDCVRRSLGAEHVIEGTAELRDAVAEQEVRPSSSLAKHQQEVAGLLGDPCAMVTSMGLS